MTGERKALFLDRDGVINVDYGYVHTPERTDFIEGIFELCRLAGEYNYLVIVVTNQAGIARGYYSETEFIAYMDWMRRAFSDQGAPLDAVYYCPHHPEEGIGSYKCTCLCRKPNPGMLIAARDEFDLDLSLSILVGDKPSDIEAGCAAGVGKCFLIEAIATQNSRMSLSRTDLSMLTSALTAAKKS